MANTITGRIQVGNTVMISGRYLMVKPSAAHFLRTCDIQLEQLFANTPTVVATVHHENIAGNAVPFLIDTIEIDLNYDSKTRINIMANEVHTRDIEEYVYWCDYIVMGEVL
jgi:hypothetical protein